MRARAARMTPAKGAVKPKSRSRSSGRMSAVAVRGQYDAARTDIRELMGWLPRLGSADQDTLSDLPALRARTRDAERNQPIAAGALLTKLDNVVGAGLTPSAQIDHDFLGLTEAEASQWQRDAQRIYDAVALTRQFDVAGRNTFPQLQRLALRAKMSGGDCFALRRYIPRAGDILALKVQLLEADRCANPPGMQNSASLRDGVAIDNYGAATGFYFANQQPNVYELGEGPTKYEYVPAMSARSGQPFVLHVIEQLRPGQTRGVPELATVLRQLKQLDRYTDSELAAAVIASFFTVFIKRNAPLDADGKPLADLEDPLTRDLIAAANEMKLGQGAIVGLEQGEDIVTANPGRPNAAMEPFVTAITKFMGVALGLPSELLLKSFNASYSASRAALMEAWRTFESQQDWLITTLCQPVYDWIITEAVGRGLLLAPGFAEDPLIRRAYLGTLWTGPTVTQLDPLKEVNAAIRRIDAGFSTRAMEAAQLTGQNWERVHVQLVRERNRRVADGLAPAEIISSGMGSMILADNNETPPQDPADGGTDAGGN